jgi:hypothetical protein
VLTLHWHRNRYKFSAVLAVMPTARGLKSGPHNGCFCDHLWGLDVKAFKCMLRYATGFCVAMSIVAPQIAISQTPIPLPPITVTGKKAPTEITESNNDSLVDSGLPKNPEMALEPMLVAAKDDIPRCKREAMVFGIIRAMGAAGTPVSGHAGSLAAQLGIIPGMVVDFIDHGVTLAGSLSRFMGSFFLPAGHDLLDFTIAGRDITGVFQVGVRYIYNDATKSVSGIQATSPMILASSGQT